MKFLSKRLILVLPICCIHDESRHPCLHSVPSLRECCFLFCFSFKIHSLVMLMASISRAYLKCLFFSSSLFKIFFHFLFLLSFMNLSRDNLTTFSHEQTFSILFSSILAKELFRCKIPASWGSYV